MNVKKLLKNFHSNAQFPLTSIAMLDHVPSHKQQWLKRKLIFQCLEENRWKVDQLKAAKAMVSKQFSHYHVCQFSGMSWAKKKFSLIFKSWWLRKETSSRNSLEEIFHFNSCFSHEWLCLSLCHHHTMAHAYTRHFHFSQYWADSILPAFHTHTIAETIFCWIFSIFLMCMRLFFYCTAWTYSSRGFNKMSIGQKITSTCCLHRDVLAERLNCLYWKE